MDFKSVNRLSTTNFLDAVLPPVPHKLVERIKSGAMVDMGEFLPGSLSITDDKNQSTTGCLV